MAEPAAETAEFAATKQKFWEVHDSIFEHQDELSDEFLVELAKRKNLDSGELVAALDSGAFADRVKKDFMSGVRSGVNGTPTFFINGTRYDGAPDFQSLSRAISTLI
jgi:protein-disulfide isomerase